MHLEELFECIEQNRQEFITKRAKKASYTGSAVGVSSQRKNGEKPADVEVEAVLAEVNVG